MKSLSFANANYRGLNNGVVMPDLDVTSLEARNAQILVLSEDGWSQKEIAEKMSLSRSFVSFVISREAKLERAEIMSAMDDKIRITKSIGSRIVNLLLNAGFETWSEARSLSWDDLLSMKNCGATNAGNIAREIKRRYPNHDLGTHSGTIHE